MKKILLGQIWRHSSSITDLRIKIITWELPNEFNGEKRIKIKVIHRGETSDACSTWQVGSYKEVGPQFLWWDLYNG